MILTVFGRNKILRFRRKNDTGYPGGCRSLQLYVFFQCIFSCFKRWLFQYKGLVAVTATVRLLPTMGYLMSFQRTTICKRLITVITTIRILSSMGSIMICKIIIFLNSLVAVTTTVMLISIVGSRMNYKTTFSCKIHVAVTATVWFLSYVYFHMIYKIKYLCKSLPLVAVTVTVRLLIIMILTTSKNYCVYSTTEIQIRLNIFYI